MTMLRQLRRRLQMKSKIALFFMILISFLSSVYSSSCDIHRFYYAESDPDPVYIHGADARKKKWTVDRIFPGCSPLSVIRDGF